MKRIYFLSNIQTALHRLQWWVAAVFCVMMMLSTNNVFGQQQNLLAKGPDNKIISPFTPTISGEGDEENGFDKEEFSVTLNVQRIGSLDVPAIIAGRNVYLSVTDVFDFLRIRNEVSDNMDSISGFFIHPEAPYLIDKVNSRIVYTEKVFQLSDNDLFQTNNALYLRSNYFGEIFGLDCTFDFRSLSVNLSTKIELPAIRDMQQELMRRNISQLKGERKADTTVRRHFKMLKLGMADWSIVSSQETHRMTNTRAWLGLGALVAGGELNITLNYNSDDTLNWRQQLYQWHYVNNDHAALRQVTAGKIFAQSISTIYAPVIGIQLTNAATTFRRSYGTYTLSNTTEPGWTVELYINNVLVNYTKADASGFYTFEVPMVYGNTSVKLRFYGPWGEERTTESYMNIPFNFTPLHQLEYNLIAGVVDNDQRSKSLRAALNYGLSRSITIGAGLEYLSSVTSGPSMPFVNTSIRLGQRTFFSAEHIRGVKSKGLLNYRLPSNFQLDLSYIRYAKGQTAIITNNEEERKLAISLPIRTRKFTAFSRLTVNQFRFANYINLPKGSTKYTSTELLISSIIAGVSSNMTTFAVFNAPSKPLVYTNLAVNLRLPKGIRFTPQAQFEYTSSRFSMLKAEAEKSIFNRGFVNLTFQKAFIRNYIDNYATSFSIGFRYNFSFAQTSSSAIKYKKTVATTQSARGSFLYDGNTRFMDWSNQSSLRRGGLVIIPFLDMNCNGRRDAGEPKAAGLKLQINGGHAVYNSKDTTIRVTSLEAYTYYFIELDKSSFDNVAWQMKHATISVSVDPNSFKQMEVPIAVVGEVSGMVMLNTDKGEKGLERIIVNIYNEAGTQVAHVMSESDGSFDFIGLAPGQYTASLEASQLNRLSLTASAPQSFTIAQKIEGDMISNLNFTLRATNNMAKSK